MQSTVNGHADTSNVIRRRAAEEKSDPLEIIGNSPSAHRRARKDVFLESRLILEIALRERGENVAVLAVNGQGCERFMRT